jgi:hypothetical protein
MIRKSRTSRRPGASRELNIGLSVYRMPPEVKKLFSPIVLIIFLFRDISVDVISKIRGFRIQV